ncbi:MAG TPA: hypothetical protein ENK83_00620 [Aliiroseovarius sp.]|nr:hypothetical protein [Aliiroseovarius sp.]
MDGEVALMAALVISANHRLMNPQDPMLWFRDQRAFARCGEISFHAATRLANGDIGEVMLAGSASEWLDQIATTNTRRVVLGFERRDEEIVPGETLPDRIAAGFAGGGSRWIMTTEPAEGDPLAWRARWRVGFPDAQDGRIWEVRHTATTGASQPLGRSVEAAATELRHALAEMSAFAWSHDVKQANSVFTSALALLDGAPDPMGLNRKLGPIDTLSDPARRLIQAAQRGWVFDNMALWDRVAIPREELRVFGQISEALYDAVTAAIVAASNP